MSSLLNPNYKLTDLVGYEANEDANVALKQSFAEVGDDGTQPRDVRHFIFKNEESENAVSSFEMRKMMLPYGFKFETIDDPYGLKMSHDREIASCEFDEFTENLKKTAEENGWVYTGWEAKVLGEHDDILRTIHAEQFERDKVEYLKQMVQSAFQENPKDGLHDLFSDLSINGDDGVSERIVSHCFKKLNNESSTKQQLTDALGRFEAIIAFSIICPKGIERVFLRHHHEIASDAFDRVVSQMVSIAESHEWEYEAVYSEMIPSAILN